MNGNKVLILAPHTDDGELGCGGTISLLLEQGKDVYYVAFSTAKESVPEGMPKNILEIEVREATKLLGINPENLIVYGFTVRKLSYVRQEILEKLVEIKKNIDPDIVFIPSPNDLHQDHHTVSMEGLRAFKDRTILGYDLPWNNMEFKKQCFIELSYKHIQSKIKAISAYKSQSFRKYVKAEYLTSWAQTLGIQVGVDFAECFEVLRMVQRIL
jgi:N-acetylglucosamine malate deacetylase 1